MDDIANYFSNLFSGQSGQPSTPNQYVGQNYPQGLEVMPSPLGYAIPPGGRRLTDYEILTRMRPKGETQLDQISGPALQRLLDTIQRRGP